LGRAAGYLVVAIVLAYLAVHIGSEEFWPRTRPVPNDPPGGFPAAAGLEGAQAPGARPVPLKLPRNAAEAVLYLFFVAIGFALAHSAIVMSGIVSLFGMGVFALAVHSFRDAVRGTE
jgi:hypothetical protein